MAKSRALSRFSPRPVIITMPRRSGRIRRAGARVVRVARRAGRGARASLPTMGIVLGGVAVGYAQQKGFLDKLPTIGGSRMLTIGLAGYAATRFIRNPHVRMAGFAALAAAAVDFGRVQAGGVSGWGDDISGTDDV